MRTLFVRSGLVCAGALALSACGVAAQDDEAGGEETVSSTSAALTASQRSAAINTKAAANSALLGAATTSYANTPSKPGGYRHYTNNASVYIGDSVGSAHIVLGLIRSKWAALGWENSILGFPYTDEYPNAFNTGRYNLFEGGRILWKYGAAAAYATHGCNDDIYGRLGFEWGTLGFPTSDETTIGDRRKNNFERGRIYFRNSSSSGCTFKSWPVLNTTAITNQLASQGAPRITSVSFTANALGANVRVLGAGFTPGSLVKFYFTNPEGSGTMYHGTGAFVQADGTFNYDTTDDGADWVQNIVVKKINNVVTVNAVVQSTGQMAVTAVSNSWLGSNYTSAY